MNDYLKHYKIKLTTLSPVYIGSGKTINKKEYIFNFEEKKVYIPDEIKMMNFFAKRKLLNSFEKYLLNDFTDFSNWLRNNGVSKAEYQAFCKYSLNAKDVFFENKGAKEINTIIKNAYGQPYIPGSSLKGAIRTILLSAVILNKQDAFKDYIAEINKVDFNNKRASAEYSKIATNKIEKRVFSKKIVGEDREERNIFQGLKISDSKPLDVKQLTLTQKIDKTLKGTTNPLPTLRESIIPNTEIEFDLTIDTSIFPFSIDAILNAIKLVNSNYNTNFIKHFLEAKPVTQNTIFLGGGTGYANKTISFALFKNDVTSIRKIVNSATPPKSNHLKDTHISPRTLKLTKYNKLDYEMGRCIIEVIKTI